MAFSLIIDLFFNSFYELSITYRGPTPRWVEFDPLEMAKEMRIEILSFSGDHAMLLGKMPLHHKDPFDRMIIAQAIVNRLPLMSDDPKFPAYSCKII